MVESETKRRTAEQLGREPRADVRRFRSLRRTSNSSRASGEAVCARCGGAWWCRWPAHWRPGWRRGDDGRGPGEIDLRKTLRKSMSTGGVPIDVVLKKAASRRRPELVVLCDVSGSVAGVSATFTLLLVHALRQQFLPGCACSPSSTPQTKSTELFRARLRPWPWPCQAHQPREAGVYTRDGHSDYGNAFALIHGEVAERPCRRGKFVAGPRRRPATTTATPRKPTLLAHMVKRESRANAQLAQSGAQAPVGQWRLGGARANQDVITMHECRSAQNSSPR